MGNEETEEHFSAELKAKIVKTFNVAKPNIVKSYEEKKKFDEDIKKLHLSHEEEKKRMAENAKEIEEKLETKFDKALEKLKDERRDSLAWYDFLPFGRPIANLF